MDIMNTLYLFILYFAKLAMRPEESVCPLLLTSFGSTAVNKFYIHPLVNFVSLAFTRPLSSGRTGTVRCRRTWLSESKVIVRKKILW